MSTQIKTQPRTISPTLTAAGVMAAINVPKTGVEVAVTHIAFGTGKYKTNGTETGLQHEMMRVAIAGGGKVSPTQIQVHAEAIAPAGSPFWCGEIGFYAGAVMFAVYSKFDQPILYFADDSVTTVSYTLGLSALPAGTVTVLVDPNVNTAIQLIGAHETAGDPHPQYLTKLRADAEYFHKLTDFASSETDCDTLIQSGVRDVIVANDRGILAATHLPMGGDGFGTLITFNGGTFIVQRYTEGGITPRTWERTGIVGQDHPFKDRIWKQIWDSSHVSPGDFVKRAGDSMGPLSSAADKPNISYAGSSVEVREAGRVTNTKGNDISYAPKLVFNWDSYTAVQLRMTDKGMLELVDGSGTAHGSFQSGTINAAKALTVAGQAVWYAGNFNPADKVSGSSNIRLNWAGNGGQPTWVFGGNAAENVNVYNPANFNVNYANSANYASTAGNANALSGVPVRFADNGAAQPYYVWGTYVGDGRVNEFTLFPRNNLAVSSAVSAVYASQLTGQGLQDGGVGSYWLNKNHTTPERAGAWQLRGSAYEYGSGTDGGIGTRIALWQRVA
ncbi:hypothetical protein ACIPF8_18665 [Collimonas sp. NPDC087041]|uniref:hypothetical protein n=1 Tax=Collimonas sp. NPDC087041 TaxID=3363960 RepID=UPI00381CEE32